MVDSGTADMAGILSALGILAKRRPILKRFTIECQSNGDSCPPLSGSRYRIVMKRFNFLLTALRRRHTLRRAEWFQSRPSRIAAQRERIGPLSFYEEVKE